MTVELVKDDCIPSGVHTFILMVEDVLIQIYILIKAISRKS